MLYFFVHAQFVSIGAFTFASISSQGLRLNPPPLSVCLSHLWTTCWCYCETPSLHFSKIYCLFSYLFISKFNFIGFVKVLGFVCLLYFVLLLLLFLFSLLVLGLKGLQCNNDNTLSQVKSFRLALVRPSQFLFVH